MAARREQRIYPPGALTACQGQGLGGVQTVWRTHARAVTIVYAVAHVYCAGGRAERNGTQQLVVYAYRLSMLQ